MISHDKQKETTRARINEHSEKPFIIFLKGGRPGLLRIVVVLRLPSLYREFFGELELSFPEFESPAAEVSLRLQSEHNKVVTAQ